jgi:hypothetical protein
MESTNQNANVFALDRARDAEQSGNPLVFEDDRDTLEAARDYLAELVRAAALDGEAPRGRVLALQVLQGPLEHLAKKIVHS